MTKTEVEVLTLALGALAVYSEVTDSLQDALSRTADLEIPKTAHNEAVTEEITKHVDQAIKGLELMSDIFPELDKATTGLVNDLYKGPEEATKSILSEALGKLVKGA
jgi:hypothetical protein